MCLLTFMSAGTTASEEDLRTGADNNPDGFGFAVHAGNRIVRRSGLNFDKVYDEFLKARAQHSGPALFHSRITTHGGTTLDNCHPFQVGRDADTVVAHNGMLPIESVGGRSDTRIFAEDLFPSWGGVRTLTSKKMRKKLSKFAAGSKLVFLTADRDIRDDYFIINEKDGHWVDGIWWSNSSYKWKRSYTYGGGSLYTSGWSKTTAADGVNEWTYHGLGSVEDCTYIDENGEEVWGELWNCGLCGHAEYYNESNIDNAEWCPNCNSCWYCSGDRYTCACYYHSSDDEKVYINPHHPENQQNGSLVIAGYDSPIDIDDLNF